MEEKTTIDFIIKTLIDWVENKRTVSPTVWLESALKMNILLDDVVKEICDLKQIIAVKKVEYIEKGMKVNEAQSRIEATDEHRKLNELQGRYKLIEEQIRLSKARAKMDSEMSINQY